MSFSLTRYKAKKKRKKKKPLINNEKHDLYLIY